MAQCELAKRAVAMGNQKPDISEDAQPPEMQQQVYMSGKIDFKTLQLNTLDGTRIRKHGFWTMQDLQDLACSILQFIETNGHQTVVSKRVCTIVCSAQGFVYQVEFGKHSDPQYQDFIFVHTNKIQGDVGLFKKFVKKLIEQFGEVSELDPN